MSADVINAKRELPVYVVHGVNWHADIVLDEDTADLDTETQIYEAASRALWAFKGNCEANFIVMDEGETTPFLGPTMICHLKGTNPTQGTIPFTHIVLANQGFYRESVKMEKLLNEELEAIKQDQIKNEQARKQIEEQTKLNNLKKPVDPEQENR